MNREDYILREISRIGEFLLALVGKLQKQKPALEIQNEFLEFTGISIDTILQTPAAQLADLLHVKNGYNHENIEKLGDLLAELPGQPAQVKALELYHLSTEMDRSYSMVREAKVAFLKQKLSLEP